MTVKDAVGIQRQAGDRQRASGPGLGLQTEPSGGKLPSRVAVRLEQALGELVPPYLLRRKHLSSGSAAETRAGGGEPRGQLPARASRDNGAGAKGLDTHAEAGAGLRGKAPRDLQDREEAGVRLQSPGGGEAGFPQACGARPQREERTWQGGQAKKAQEVGTRATRNGNQQNLGGRRRCPCGPTNPSLSKRHGEPAIPSSRLPGPRARAGARAPRSQRDTGPRGDPSAPAAASAASAQPPSS